MVVKKSTCLEIYIHIYIMPPPKKPQQQQQKSQMSVSLLLTLHPSPYAIGTLLTFVFLSAPSNLPSVLALQLLATHPAAEPAVLWGLLAKPVFPKRLVHWAIS